MGMTHLSEAILRDTKGINLVLHDPLVVQNIRAVVDFFLLDCATRPCDTQVVSNLLYAAGDTNFIVRPANTHPAVLQGLLNLGVDGLVLPDIHYAAELEKIIAACLYPPEGIRPYRPVISQDKIMLDAINDQITFVVEVNHPQTIAQLEEIAEVTGINGLLVCPQRLSVAMEKGGDVHHASVQQALQTIARIAATYELPWGIEGEEAFDLQPDFTLPTRDIDLLINGLSRKKIGSDSSLAFQDEEEFSPFTLSARRE